MELLKNILFKFIVMVKVSKFLDYDELLARIDLLLLAVLIFIINIKQFFISDISLR